jgi:hypothetical protein
MGYEASCTLTYDGKRTRGTVWLEHKEIVFRGPTRLAIPLESITSAKAKDGTLLLQFNGRTAELAVGEAAEKWAKRITNPPSRLDKLGIKPGMSVAAIGVGDASFLDELAEREAKVSRTTPKASDPVDVIFYGASHRDALTRLAALSNLIKPNGAMWVVRPKGRPEITEAEAMAAGKGAGLVDVKVVSFSDTHTAEKFVIPVAKRPASRK